MKYIPTMSLACLAIASTAFAGGACGAGGCKPACCTNRTVCEDSVQPCKPVAKKVDITATCYKIETKKIVIPPTRFPWDPPICCGAEGECGSKCGAGGKCGAKCSCGPNCGCGAKCGAAGQCGSKGQCGAGCGPEKSCKAGFFNDLLTPFKDRCCLVKCIKIPKKSKKKVGEKCVCEWKIENCGSCTGKKPACAAPQAAPKASAPAAAPEPAPAPPKEARRIRVPGYGMQDGLRSILTVKID